MSKKLRLDKLVVERGLEVSRTRAHARIMAGECRVGGRAVTKPGHQVSRDADIEFVGGGLKFVSRGGLKLEQALDASELTVDGQVCMDVGASTGGFTDCLLQRGASAVFAVDVGYGQLAWKLRNDPRVTVLERTNIRHLARELVTRPIDTAVVDCSFISLRTVYPAMAPFLEVGSRVVALVKPQFEVGRENLGSHGVVRDLDARRNAIDEVSEAVSAAGLRVDGGVDCDTHGPKGNVEYLLWGTVERVPRTNESASPSA
ncbi:MAG: 23S rRNA (cytidine1920-2'-O)/16S rRNA (cytidine1409-2'-O)-methyltransferase [Bradymonadia bacterium]|jgi:23S rRNA (cytidine1920-2'-O)/16S rRNA (cytidine1409-2'-O)-methyltransferase